MVVGFFIPAFWYIAISLALLAAAISAYVSYKAVTAVTGPVGEDRKDQDAGGLGRVESEAAPPEPDAFGADQLGPSAGQVSRERRDRRRREAAADAAVAADERREQAHSFAADETLARERDRRRKADER